MAEIALAPKEHVEKMLKDYQQNKRIMAANAEAIELFVPLTDDEVLEMLNFGSRGELQVQNTNISQKVARISETYKRAANSWNKEALQAMMAEYQAALAEVSFVDYSIRQLPEREREIMSMFVVKAAAWTEVCNASHLSNAMVGKYRRKAIEQMSQVYARNFSKFIVETGLMKMDGR